MSGIKPILFYSKKPKDVQTVIPTNAVDSGDEEESDFEDVFHESEMPIQSERGDGNAELEVPSTSNNYISPAVRLASGRPVRTSRRQCLPLLVDNMQEENSCRSESEDEMPQENVRLANLHRNLHVWTREDILESTTIQTSNNIHFEENNNKSPLDYFSYYFDEQILEHVSHQCNLYSVQKEGVSVNTNPKELQAFLSIMIYMRVCKLPGVVDYWAQHTRIDQIAPVMPHKRFK